MLTKMKKNAGVSNKYVEVVLEQQSRLNRALETCAEQVEVA